MNRTTISERPRVICHMMASVDGRIVTDDWPLTEAERGEYDRVHDSYEADGWLVGRVTLERHFAAGVRTDAEIAREHDGPAREDFVSSGEHESFAFAVDPSGKLVWKSGDVDGDHLVTILTERVSEEYLATLRAAGVSYLLAGRDELDLPGALEKIGARLGVRTLMLEGGGGINGSMLRAGLVDELSLLVAPVGDGRVGTAALFDIDPSRSLPSSPSASLRAGSATGSGQAHDDPSPSSGQADYTPVRLALVAAERRADDVLWLRYRVEAPKP